MTNVSQALNDELDKYRFLFNRITYRDGWPTQVTIDIECRTLPGYSNDEQLFFLPPSQAQRVKKNKEGRMRRLNLIDVSEHDADRRVWRSAYGKISGDRRYSDDRPMIERYTRTANGGELSVWDDNGQSFNPDLPDNVAFIGMGLACRENEMIDRRRYDLVDLAGQRIERSWRPMDAADMTERCVAYGNTLYAIHERRAIDLQPAWFKRFELIAEVLDIPMDLAHRLCRVLTGNASATESSRDRDFTFNQSMMNRLLNGYTTMDGEIRGGLKSLRGDADAISELVDMLEALNADANAAAESERDEYSEYWESVAEPQEDAFFDGRLIYSVEGEDATGDDDSEEWTDGFDESVTMGTNAFSAHRLYGDGRDGLPYEFIDYIKTADASQIAELQKAMFKSEDPYTGRVYPAKYGFLTGAQKSQMWAFINARKDKMRVTGLRQLDRDGRQVLELVRELGVCGQARALIAAWAEGNDFDVCGVMMHFDRKPSDAAKYAMWGEYRKLKK